MKIFHVACLSMAVVACGDDDDGANGNGTTPPPATSQCTAARSENVVSVDKIAPGAVSELESGTLLVDATAGGIQAAASNARTYVNLATGTKVDVTDVAAPSSTAWDLAVKRSVLFTNSGDGGSGQGGAVFLAKSFDEVTAADADSAAFVSETFFDAECNALKDEIGDIRTSFSGWYDYSMQGSKVTPRSGTYLVRGATGERYKMQILGYYGNADGSTEGAGARYVLKVGAL